MSSQLEDVLWGSGPEHKAVSLILKAGFDGRLLQAQQHRVDDESLEIWG